MAATSPRHQNRTDRPGEGSGMSYSRLYMNDTKHRIKKKLVVDTGGYKEMSSILADQ
jgi:hypothetical protein